MMDSSETAFLWPGTKNPTWKPKTRFVVLGTIPGCRAVDFTHCPLLHAMNTIRTYLVIAVITMGMVGLASSASAQYYINQSALADILAPCGADIDVLPEVHYQYFVLYSSRGNNVLARNTMYKVLGKGDVDIGRKRSKLVEILNRTLLQFASIGDTLVIPDQFDLDFCAYAPFPRYYRGARDFDKIFIIDKNIQAWAAYEFGKLKRWGIVSTGGSESPTPKGRFNFNWKTKYRISSLSPTDEPWEMYWVFNFVESRGIHIHQYAMPTGGPQSHGCVRLVEEDAKWMYDWASGWKKDASGKIVRQGTTVLVIGDEPVGKPTPFISKANFPVLRKVVLPDDPYDVPPGEDQQSQFDRLRGTR